MPVEQATVQSGLSVWHFFWTSVVWTTIAGSIFNAFFGVLGVGAVKPNATKWPAWVWVSMAIGILIALVGGWESAKGNRDADQDRRDTKSDLTDIRAKMDRIADAAHVDKSIPLGQMIDQIIAKIPTIQQSNIDKNSGTVGINGAVTGPVKQYFGDQKKTAPTPDHDSFYQFGKIVATVSGAHEHRAEGFIAFDVIRQSSQANPKKSFAYRDLSLDCSHDVDGKELPPNVPPPGIFAGTTMDRPVLGWTCAIVGERK